MRSFIFAGMLSATLALLIACGDPAKPIKVEKVRPTPAAGVDTHGHEDTAQRISVADAKALFDKGEAVFVDTRAAATWANEHIKGSINIPAEEAAVRASEIPKGKKVVAYCS